jgi:RNA polymerase sigma factor (TIGR02999 family)
MRQIVIDHARARASGRRGGDAVRVPLVDAEAIASDDAELVDLDAALDRLDEISPPLRELVELRVFAGMTLEQLAEACGRSLRSINRDWQRARALLIAQMG